MSYPAEPDGGQTAFRLAEKKYQLHRDQIVKHNKRGRARGTKLVKRATDVSDLLDPAEAAQSAPAGGTHVAAHWCSALGTAVLSFSGRPGLFVIPGALTPAQQRRLVIDSLTRFPQPPNHTNFTRQHGLLPEEPTLWEAAQLGLCLQCQAGEPGPSRAACDRRGPGQGGCAHPCEPCSQTVMHADGTAAAAGVAGSCCERPAAAAGAARVQRQSPAAPAAPEVLPDSTGAAGCPADPAACSAPRQQGSSSSAREEPPARPTGVFAGAGAAWSPAAGCSAAKALPAAKLLRKLRWATLGPPFDWTQRVYRRDVPHSPLPAYLAELAVRLAGAVEGLGCSSDGRCESCCGGGGTSSDAVGPCQKQMEGLQEDEGCSCCRQRHGGGGSSSGRRPFRPDVALLNYYHEGDTLGGHVDDAELDLAHPIVTLSLGCEAVFLAGGLTRDVAPLALLLRSGDAVVMAGEARRCYHGVPRIFTDRPLPPALGAAAGEGPGDFSVFAQHMRGCRINISVRAAA